MWTRILFAALAAASACAALDIPERQRKLRVPGVSIAILAEGRIARTEVYGSGITPSTLFQAASISKPVAAMAALHMMQYGHFGLDEDINAKLKSWKIPANGFRQPVTLRSLLSHSAGLTVSGFAGYENGAPIPSLEAILKGQPPANNTPVVVDTEPGSTWRYSGGGYVVLQQLLTDRMGWTFPQIMERIVLSRLGMKDSTFLQPLPPELAARAAAGHDAKGEPLPGKWHVYPELAAAGLWTTPSDLAHWAIEVREAWHGRSNRILERSTAREMLTRQKGDYGLGVRLSGDGDALAFGHTGSNAGFRCGFRLVLSNGRGAVVMTNADNGSALVQEILDELAR